MISTDQMQQMIDKDGVVVDADGDKVGKIGQVYLDDDSGNPEWVTVKTGLFGTSETFVPLSAADLSDDAIRVPYDKATIKDAPRIDADQHLSPEQEDDLYRHYQDVAGRSSAVGEDSHRDRDGHVGDDRDRDGHVGDDRDRDRDGHVGDDGHHDRDGHVERDGAGAEGGSMVRSEEQVEVGKEKVESGRARLRKYVVTEDVTTTVPVEREEVRLEREPINDGDVRDGDVSADGDIGEQEQEVVLTEERVTVNKETVPVERVNLGTETVTDDQEVTEEVRKEQIEADGPDGGDVTDAEARDR